MGELIENFIEYKSEDDKEEKLRKCWVSELVGVSFKFFSLLMEFWELVNIFLIFLSNMFFFKVKWNKFLVVCGIFKMFGSRYKYKVDKVGKGMVVVVLDFEKNFVFFDECDLKENCNEKKNKKEKSFKWYSSKWKLDKIIVDFVDDNLNYDEIDLKED